MRAPITEKSKKGSDNLIREWRFPPGGLIKIPEAKFFPGKWFGKSRSISDIPALSRNPLVFSFPWGGSPARRSQVGGRGSGRTWGFARRRRDLSRDRDLKRWCIKRFIGAVEEIDGLFEMKSSRSLTCYPINGKRPAICSLSLILADSAASPVGISPDHLLFQSLLRRFPRTPHWRVSHCISEAISTWLPLSNSTKLIRKNWFIGSCSSFKSHKVRPAAREKNADTFPGGGRAD